MNPSIPHALFNAVAHAFTQIMVDEEGCGALFGALGFFDADGCKWLDMRAGARPRLHLNWQEKEYS
jgi:hypothetical protein